MHVIKNLLLLLVSVGIECDMITCNLPMIQKMKLLLVYFFKATKRSCKEKLYYFTFTFQFEI